MTQMPQLHTLVLGINHRTGTVELRDQLMFREREASDFRNLLQSNCGARECVILSTCNRTEIYLASDNPELCLEQLPKLWAEFKKVPVQQIIDHTYHFLHLPAIKHLYKVTCSLDSMVLGEAQIFGQVKDAYQDALKDKNAGFLLNQVFQNAIRVGKRVRAETHINEGAVSISYAAVELAKKVMGDLHHKVVGVIGSGEMGTLASHHLQRSGVNRFLFFNRSLSTAEELAADFGGECATLDAMSQKLYECDIVISATGAPDYVLTKNIVQASMKKRGGNPQFFIDIAAPRDIEPDAESVYNVFVFTIDDLQSAIKENEQSRRQSATDALAIITEELSHLEAWYQSLDLIPVIKALRSEYEKLLQKELHHFRNFSDSESTELEKFGRRLMNKFLHPPCMGIKHLGEKGDTIQALYYLKELFNLPKYEDSDE